MGALSAVMTGLSVISTLAGGSAQASAIKAAGRNQQAMANWQGEVARQQGISAKNMADYKASQARTAAGQERAAAQRAALEQKRKGRLARSTAIARAGAGGATAEDIYSTLAGIGSEAEYAAATERYKGEDAARGFLDQGAMYEYEGNEAMRSAELAAQGYQVQGAMDYATAKTQAANIRNKSYSDAFGTIGNFAMSSTGQSLMDKYAPQRETITWYT